MMGMILPLPRPFTHSLGSLERFWGQDCCLQSAEDRVHIIWVSLDLQKNLHFVLLIGRLLGTGTQWFIIQAQPWRVSVSSSQLDEQQQLSGSDPRECRLHLGSVGAQLGTALPWQKSQCLAWFLQPASTLTSSAYLTWAWRGSRGCLGLDNTCQFIQFDPEAGKLWGVMCLGYTRCRLPTYSFATLPCHPGHILLSVKQGKQQTLKFSLLCAGANSMLLGHKSFHLYSNLFVIISFFQCENRGPKKCNAF